jgi:hypothetical protein
MESQAKRSRRLCIYCNDGFSDRHFRRHILECQNSNNIESTCNISQDFDHFSENEKSVCMKEVSFSDDNEQDIDYTKYFKCTTIFLTISNLCEEDIRSYFDNIQDDSVSDIQDHFSDYELSESENEDMTVENANNMDAIVYSETYWFCLF